MTLRVALRVGSADLGWIIGRWARELEARLPAYGVEATINGTGSYDLDFHPVVYGDPERRPAIGLFTHGDFRPRRYATAYDGQIALNSVMRDYLVEGGASHPAIIAPAIDAAYSPGRRLVFGVSGRTYADGRKGEHMVKAMVEAGYLVRAWGSGWPCYIVSDDLRDLPDFYRQLDFYVDTSNDEGGCVGALEAMAMGLPVISHTVGVERPVLAYERGSWESLSAVLRALTVPRTYDDFAADHARYFHEVMARLAVAA